MDTAITTPPDLDSILRDYLQGDLPLEGIAARHRLSLRAFADLLTSPEAQDLLATLEAIALRRRDHLHARAAATALVQLEGLLATDTGDNPAETRRRAALVLKRLPAPPEPRPRPADAPRAALPPTSAIAPTPGPTPAPWATDHHPPALESAAPNTPIPLPTAGGTDLPRATDFGPAKSVPRDPGILHPLQLVSSPN